ncbi:MAG: hypothetical protein ACU0DK_15840 [Pseudooceanicola sp.]
MTPEELRDWLEARPEETRAREAAWIAFRAAARAQPFIMREYSRSAELDNRIIHSLYRTLAAELAAFADAPSEPVLSPLENVEEVVALADPSDHAVEASAAALSCVELWRLQDGPADLKDITDAAMLAYTKARGAAHDSYAWYAELDARHLGDGAGNIPPVLKLWHGEGGARVQEIWSLARGRLPGTHEGSRHSGYGQSYGAGYGGWDDDDWTFWIDWYDGLLEGRAMPRDLLTEVARIPAEDWLNRANPGHVNRMIAAIYRRHRLRAEASELRQGLADAGIVTASADMRGHNNPPELIAGESDQAMLSRSLLTVAQAAEAAEDELEKDEPNAIALSSAARKLASAAKAALYYLAQKTDVFLDAFAKQMGSSAAKALAGGGFLILMERALNLSEALKAFAGF